MDEDFYNAIATNEEREMVSKKIYNKRRFGRLLKQTYNFPIFRGNKCHGNCQARDRVSAAQLQVRN